MCAIRQEASANAIANDPDNSTQTLSSHESSRMTLTERLRADPSREQARWSLTLAIFFAVAGISQWIIFTPAIANLGSIRLGAVIDILLVFGLLLVNYHRAYWQHMLDQYALEAKYMGVEMDI